MDVSVCRRRSPYSDCGCANCQIGVGGWVGWVGVEGAHLEGIYCIIQSIIAAVGA